jgi:hypothetical protein
MRESIRLCGEIVRVGDTIRVMDEYDREKHTSTVARIALHMIIFTDGMGTCLADYERGHASGTVQVEVIKRAPQNDSSF